MFNVGDRVRVVFSGEETVKGEPLFDTGVIIEVDGELRVDCSISEDRDEITGDGISNTYALDDEDIERIELIEDDE